MINIVSMGISKDRSSTTISGNRWREISGLCQYNPCLTCKPIEPFGMSASAIPSYTTYWACQSNLSIYNMEYHIIRLTEHHLEPLFSLSHLAPSTCILISSTSTSLWRMRNENIPSLQKLWLYGRMYLFQRLLQICAISISTTLPFTLPMGTSSYIPWLICSCSNEYVDLYTQKGSLSSARDNNNMSSKVCQ